MMNEKAEYYTQLLVNTDKGVESSGTGTYFIKAACAGAMLLWWLDAGFVSDVQWYIALLYGFGASLVANGIADTGLVQWLIGLIVKKSESKS